MNAHIMQPSTGAYAYSVAPLYISFMLLSLLITCSTLPLAAQQQHASLIVNAAANPLRHFGVQGESHPFFVDIDADGDLDCFAGEYTNGAGFSTIHFYRNEGTRKAPLFKPVHGASNP